MKFIKVIVDEKPEEPCTECPFYHRPFTEDDSTCALCEMLGVDECLLEESSCTTSQE